MKNIVRYTNLNIPNKIRMDTRITVDDNRSVEYLSSFNGDNNASIGIYPIISLAIVKPSDVDENGNKTKPPWNPNDVLGMTKYTFPLFINEMNDIRQDLKTPDLYTYIGERLEVNETLADKFRKVFKIGNVTVEISTVVIVQTEDDTRVEGIKLKFNNEDSSVLLTINDLDAILYNMKSLNIDNLVYMMYQDYIKPNKSTATPTLPAPKVDIVPKKSEFDLPM